MKIDPFLKTEVGKAVYTVTKHYILEGVKTFEEFSKKMVDEFGDLLKPHMENLRSVWESAVSEHTLETARLKNAMVEAQTEAIPSSSDIHKNHQTENQKLEQENKYFGMAINPFIKKSLEIFVFLAIIISLFPPFEFHLAKEEYHGTSHVLPVKKYDFLFGDGKKLVDLDDKIWGTQSGSYLVDRKILFGELLVEYILAFFVSIILGYGIQVIRLRKISLPKY